MKPEHFFFPFPIPERELVQPKPSTAITQCLGSVLRTAFLFLSQEYSPFSPVFLLSCLNIFTNIWVFPPLEFHHVVVIYPVNRIFFCFKTHTWRVCSPGIKNAFCSLIFFCVWRPAGPFLIVCLWLCMFLSVCFEYWETLPFWIHITYLLIFSQTWLGLALLTTNTIHSRVKKRML